jgi:putative membrane-bound dehydrogenase-like protein
MNDSIRVFVPAMFLCGLLALPAAAQGLTPEQALKRMQVPDGLQVKLVAAEPMIRQPVTMSFDARGRMWVIQYLQYPNPAGLKPVHVDQYLRTKYDRVPEPPPKGPRGADRITILEDPDEHGRFRKSKDFVTGLNLASGMCIGHGGVFVVQPPYLLFYPDRDGDDVPDGDPEVLLTGFGMEDAHALANSLQWGPDGWLYGAQGSTVNANIRGIEFVQGIWRYHPLTKEFELFAEGGGNTWGVDFDRHGNVIAGTNFGGNAMLHQVQGAFYVKNFTKHGALKNPHAYGYFGHVPYQGFKGGHVTCGGIVYQGGALPAKYHHQYIAGNLLSNSLYWHILERDGSSFKARFGGDFLLSNDPWFRPVDCLTGPDGAVYVADWHDKRATHLDPVDNWDRSNGRIFRVEPQGAKPLPAFNLAKMTSLELVDLLSHENDWFRREARRILAERRDESVVGRLRELVLNRKDHLALEALWAVYVSGGFNDNVARQTLDHANEDVRTWTVRLLGDAKKVSVPIRNRLVRLAKHDPSPAVRNQLACSCKRLPAADALPIVRQLLRRDEDAQDPQIPLLLWWAIEAKAVSDRDAVLGLLGDAEAWRLPLVRQFILERIGRRYLAENSDAGLRACAWLLDTAPGAAEVDLLVKGMDLALEGRQLAQVPAVLEKQIDKLRAERPDDLKRLRLALRLGSAPAYADALKRVSDPKTPEGTRLSLVEVLGQAGRAECVPALLTLFEQAKGDPLRKALLAALQPYTDTRIGESLLRHYPKLSADLRGRAQALLASRPASARALVQAVEAGHISAKEIGLDPVRQLAQHKDKELLKLVEKYWGRVGAATAGEKVTRIRYIATALTRGKGDPAAGVALFDKHCASCHTLFGRGTKLGPDLTTADRKNREWLLLNVVDPSAVVRLEYAAYNVVTADGRVLSGLIAEATPQAVTLVDAKNERTVLPRDQIDQMNPSPTSLMPEKLLDTLSDQELRDLFSYIQSDAPPPQAKQGQKKLKVCLVSGSLEYKSDESLAAFQKYLEANYPVECTRAFRKTDDDLPGLENLETCDVMLLYTRRLTIKGEQLERVKKYCKSGKPIVALRTASHAFQNWLALDKEVLGGNYQGHYGAGPVADIGIVEAAKSHPILKGVQPFKSAGSLYKNTGVSKDVTLLLNGSIPKHTEPVAWTRVHNGGRVFYTSLGHPQDFQDEQFRRLVVNALYWTCQRDVPKK